MGWTKLADRLDTLPSVLAGPLLRQVTPEAVTVWVALRKSAYVTLTVEDDKNTQLMEGSRQTTAIGKNLHIVAVTALKQGSSLTEGVIYQYNLIFKFNGLTKTLSAATGSADLAYPPFTLPSFTLPPHDMNRVRLIHGSCRMPHAYGKDTLPLLDDLIAQTAENALDRPHQLLLSGDQIYADDVADSLLVLLADAGDQLLDWKEVLPPSETGGAALTAADLCPFLRSETLSAAGFTSDDLRSHLMSLGEYLSMYLFVWSEVLWPVTLPSFVDISAGVEASDPDRPPMWKKFLLMKKKGIESSVDSVDEFRKTVPAVRRALANIPSYMIFDDHEVTDDWDMTRNFCRGVYGNPLGLRVVQNALVAYALCQHWGNVPEQFEDSTAGEPAGGTLLRLLESGTASTYDDSSALLRTIIGVHDYATLKTKDDTGNYHDQKNWVNIRGQIVSRDSLTYNFTIEMAAYQVIFTDTRSWRSYPNGDDSSPHLLPRAQMQAQILGTPPLGDRTLLVVLSTNMPPIEPIRSALVHSTLTTKLGDSAFPDIYESWELPTTSFDRLLSRLTDKLSKDAAGTLYGRVILLSGDVHHSFASRLIYRATTRFEDQQPQPATAVFAQLVSSSFKKQTTSTLGLHREGYEFAPTGMGWLIPDHKPEGYVGWNVPLNSGKLVGRIVATAGASVGLADLALEEPTFPCVSGTGGSVISIELSVAPDYRYRLDYLVAAMQGAQPSNLDPIPPIPAGATAADRKKAAEAFHKATAHYRDYNNSADSTREIVGRNNMGEVTFDWGSGDAKKVNHTLRWWHTTKSKVQWSTYTVSLDPNDAGFPDIKSVNGL